jgi:integrase
MSGKTIENFLELYPRYNTRKGYRAAIYDFLDHIYGPVRAGSRVTNGEKKTYEGLCTRYFAEERDLLTDLIKYIGAKNGTPPATIKNKVSALKEWLSFNGVEFSQRELKTLRHKTPRAKGSWTVEGEFDTENLRKILAHTDEKGAALILTLASSGMRINEALNVTLNDMDLSKEPPEIIVRGAYTKSNETRVVFISQEAKAAVEAWLNVRENYIKSARNRNKGLIKSGDAKPKREKDDRLFPFAEAVVREFWSRALEKAGLDGKDNSTGRLQYRIHGLRKFFRSQLALSCPLDIVETLMGHEGYLTDAYRRYTRKQMGEYYRKAEHHVTVMGSGDLREIQDRLQDTQAAVEGYRSIISTQAEEMVELRRRLEELEAERDDITALDTVMTELMKRLIKDPENDLKEHLKAMRSEGLIDETVIKQS